MGKGSKSNGKGGGDFERVFWKIVVKFLPFHAFRGEEWDNYIILFYFKLAEKVVILANDIDITRWFYFILNFTFKIKSVYQC
jgi:hypothetical protein